MENPTNQELEELRDLVMSPGWARFRDKMAERHGPVQFGARVLSWDGSTDAELVARIRREKAVMDSIGEMLDWPRRRIAALEREAR